MGKGFSLVELSIVLVILGLLVGGILAGQSLIRASELRAVTTEQQRYRTATYAFRDKYFKLPGDFDRATEVWGTAAACPGDYTQPSTDRSTCNGNGDGLLSASSTASVGNERFRYWQHLANAGLIEGTYTGVSGSGSATNHHVRGQNVPASKLSGACWSHLHWASAVTGDVSSFDNPGGSRLFIGKDSTNGSCVQAFLKPEEAWNVDVKSDDGVPGTGHTIAYFWDDCTDAASSAALTANYALNVNSAVCSLNFKGFY